MSSPIKDEYSKPVKPAVESVTIKSVLIGSGAVVLEHVVASSPVLAMLIWSILPSWLQTMLTPDIISSAIEAALLGVAGYAGVTIVKERLKKGDIEGVLKTP